MSASTEKKQRVVSREAGTYKKDLAAKEEAKKDSVRKRRTVIGAIVLVVVILFVIFTNSGMLYRNTTAVTVDGIKFSPAQLTYYYGTVFNNYLNMFSQYGIDASSLGIDTSYGISSISGSAMSDSMVESAVEQLKEVVALSEYAKANGITLSDDEYAEIDSTVESFEAYAEASGVSLNAYLAYCYGQGINETIFRQELERCYLADAADSAYSDSITCTDEEADEYYETLNGTYDTVGYVVYSISEDADSDGTVTDAERIDAQEEADAIIASYNEAEGSIDEKLTAAVNAQGVETTLSASYAKIVNLNSNFSEWLTEQTEEGVITSIENADQTTLYVVAFIDHEDNNFHTATVRHILVKAVADENGEYTEEALAEAKAKAEEYLAEWQSGEATEDSFAALANEVSEDTGSNTTGGLYTVSDRHSYVEEFTDFALGDHQPGDTAIVYGESSSYAGYHIMYYVEQGGLASTELAKDLVISSKYTEWYDALTSSVTAETGFGYKYVG